MIVRFLVNALALALATWLLPGIVLREGPLEQRGIAMLLVAVIFGLVNSLVKPVFVFVTSPVLLATLGLFLLVINAALLLLTSWVCARLRIGWAVDDLPSAFWGALLVSVVSFVLSAIFVRREKEHR